MVEIIQADRDAAAALEVALGNVGSAFTAHITEGLEDDSATVQAFARHRLASTPKLTGDAAVERDGWQDIGSAPKDGTWFIARQDGETYPCEWRLEIPDEGPPHEGWFDHFNQSFEVPTEWWPAPLAALAAPEETTNVE